MKPEFLTYIDANTSLETPQILVEWTFDNPVSPIDPGLSYLWSDLYIRRGEFRYPEGVTEGTAILTEVYSTSPSIYKADIASMDALKEYYYSIFFRYLAHSSSLISLDQDISRLCTVVYSVKEEVQTPIFTRIDEGSSAVGSPIFTDVIGGFYTNNVEAGFILQIHEGGADDGYYTILSVDSDTQVTLTSNLTLLAVGTIDFSVYSDHKKFWICGKDYQNLSVLYRYDSQTLMVDYKIDLSGLLNSGEIVRSVVHTGEKSGEIGIVTNTRYVSFTINTTPDAGDIIQEWNLDGRLEPGYLVTGSCYSLANTYIYLLDSNHMSIVTVNEITGAVVTTMDISGLPDASISTIRGLGLDTVGFGGVEWLLIGNSNYVYSIAENAVAPDDSGVEMVTYTEDVIGSDISFYLDLVTGIRRIVTIVDPSDSQMLMSYELEISRGYLWQQPYVSDLYTIALYHFEDTNPVVLSDSSVNAFDGVNTMTVQEEGRFSFGFEADAVAEIVDIIAIAPAFNGAFGTASVWFKVSDTDDLSAAANRYILWLEVNANNRIKIGIEGTNLLFEYTAGAVTKSVAAAHPSIDTNWHNYLITWNNITGDMEAYFDGVQFGATQAGIGVWAGVLAIANIGGSGANTLLGFYDECRVSAYVRIVHPYVYRYTGANKAAAFSGRDYSTGYVDGERLTFHYRDQLYTNRFLGGDYLIDNDYEKGILFPADTIAYDGSIIYRDAIPPELGDLGRTTRILGSIFDRISEERERLLTLFNEDICDSRYLDELAYYLGIQGLDTEWNIDDQRRYIKVMRRNIQKGGRLLSYEIYARLLGFLLTETTLLARRFWDSVVDPLRTDIFLDQMGAMDTGSALYPNAFLNFTIYKEIDRSSVGSTVGPNRFIDGTATFSSTVSVGDLLKIYDLDDTGDNGEYIIDQVISDNILLVTPIWPLGGLNNLSYRTGTKVPSVDPYASYLLTRFKDIAPFCIEMLAV